MKESWRLALGMLRAVSASRWQLSSIPNGQRLSERSMICILQQAWTLSSWPWYQLDSSVACHLLDPAVCPDWHHRPERKGV